jgi:hypothetical protein
MDAAEVEFTFTNQQIASLRMSLLMSSTEILSAGRSPRILLLKGVKRQMVTDLGSIPEQDLIIQ